jgi:protein TonB
METPRASLGTFDTVAAEGKNSGSRMVIIGVVAMVVIAAGATFGFLKLRKPDAAQHQPEAASVPPAQTSSVPPSGNAQPSIPTGNTPASGASVASSAVVPAKPASEADSAHKGSSKTSHDVVVTATAEKPAPVTTLASSGTSKITQNKTTAQPTADVAPSFGVVGNSTPGGLSALAKPTASTPAAASIEQSSLEPLQLIKTSPLPYPSIARARRISGIVVVQVKIGKDGKVTNPQFISGPPIFKDSAFEAVTQYQFKPARLNGQPIDQTTQIRMNFHP